jgi:hypothetical protein
MDGNTFRAVNKVLMERSSTNISNDTLSNTNCDNIVVNYVLPSIAKIGSQNLSHTLTDPEKTQIMDSKYRPLEKMVDFVHCGTRDY